MFSRFFIDRPIFAAVLSIVIVVSGLVAAVTLPIAQYPDITPPTVQVSCLYPGANAQVVADTVAAPIEQQVNGVERMLYMSSQSTNDGAYNLTVTFELGTDLNMAQVLVQNRVAMAEPLLPDEVRQSGVTTKKKSPNILLAVNLFSPDGRYDQLYLSNYATIRIRDELARVQGVGDVSYLGQQDYSMRVWLEPEKLAELHMSVGDVIAALREQNVQVAAGQIGAPPVPHGQDFQYTMSTLGRLVDPEQFADIIVRQGTKGQVIRVRDVARVELGAKSVNQSCSLDGKPSVGLAAFQLPGSNAVQTAEKVRQRMEQLKRRFPPGLDYAIVYDTTPFINESVREVFKTLRDATLLVALVVLIFLQNWRAVLIPLVAVPVSIVGTFAVMIAFGFSLNNVSLCGLVLAIGIVVDDAIVVVENVERWMEHGLSPREAAYKSMEEVTVAVIAIAFGLSAIFIPTAFMSGIPGQFYRQFALTIAASTLISAFNSLTLSPALAAIILRPRHAKPDWLTWLINLLFGRLFRGFNRVFDGVTGIYGHLVRWCIRGTAIMLLLYVGLVGLTGYSFVKVPTGFVPTQDKGYLLLTVQLPEAASLERTQEVMRRVDALVAETHGVVHRIGISGQSFLLNAAGSNFGSMFVILDEFHHRRDPQLSADAIAQQLRQRCFAEIEDAQVAVFGAPAVDGLGNAGGFAMMVQDRGDMGLLALQGQVGMLVEKGNAEQGTLIGLFSMFRADSPQLYVQVDRTKCKSMGVPLSEVFSALQGYLGGYYVNDFNQFGRTWQVNVQADAAYRIRPDSVRQLKVRNAEGEMVPLGSVVEIKDSSGPILINRYNMYPAASINGAWPPTASSGQAIAAMERLAEETLPQSMAFEWTELTYLQVLAGNTALYIFPICILFVFLTHSAEYESWMLPLAIILIVPMSLLCALGGVWLRGMDDNLFTQIGFLVLAGLACKNAVLIVEFAKQQREQGVPLRDAAIEACRLRLRPIVMTSFAFILGVVPLALAQGAGAELRQTLGTAVFFGMLGVTVFGLFLTPVFYFVLQGISEWFSPHLPHRPTPPTPTYTGEPIQGDR